MANTKLPSRLLDTSAIPALNVTGDLTVDTTTLKVDSTNNRVGIGIASPKTTLNVAANNSGQGPILTLENTDTSITTGDVIGQIDFYANDGSSNGTGPKVNIKAVADSGAGTVTELTFGTSPSSSATAIERMRIDASGKVGIGTSAPATNLHVSTTSSHSEIRVSSSASGSGTVPAVSLNNTVAEWGMGILGDNHLHFRENTASYASRLTIADGGNIGIGMTNPTAKLHLDNPSAFTNMIEYGNVTWNQNSGHGLVAVNRGSDGYVQLQLTSGVDNADVFTIRNSGTGANVQHNLLSNGNAYHAGNVGIGNTNPSSKLEVGNGSSTYVKIRNASTGDVSSGYNIMSGSTTTTSLYGNAGEGWTTLLSGGALNFRVNNAVSGFNPLGIDTSGRVSMPYQAGFFARGNTSQWLQGHASSWNTIVAGIAHANGSTIGVNLTEGATGHLNGYDIGSDFNTSNGRFTAPIEGKYHIHGSIYCMKNGTNANDYMHFLVYVNGQQINQMYTMGGHGQSFALDFSLNISSVLFLEANDIVEWKVYTTSTNMRIYGDHLCIGAHMIS